jgi:hypothetical protein
MVERLAVSEVGLAKTRQLDLFPPHSSLSSEDRHTHSKQGIRRYIIPNSILQKGRSQSHLTILSRIHLSKLVTLGSSKLGGNSRTRLIINLFNQQLLPLLSAPSQRVGSGMENMA